MDPTGSIDSSYPGARRYSQSAMGQMPPPPPSSTTGGSSGPVLTTGGLSSFPKAIFPQQYNLNSGASGTLKRKSMSGMNGSNKTNNNHSTGNEDENDYSYADTSYDSSSSFHHPHQRPPPTEGHANQGGPPPPPHAHMQSYPYDASAGMVPLSAKRRSSLASNDDTGSTNSGSVGMGHANSRIRGMHIDEGRREGELRALRGCHLGHGRSRIGAVQG